MHPKRKLQLTLTPADRAIEKMNLVLFIFLWVFTIYCFLKLPEIIPIHFDAAGRPDNYGTKWSLFLLPVIVSILYPALTYLNKFPEIFNYPVKITAKNAESQYSLATRMMRVVICSIMLIFSIIALYSFRTGGGNGASPGWWLLPLILAIIFIPIIYFSIKMLKVSATSSKF